MISPLEIVGVAIASLVGSSIMWLTLGPYVVEKYAFMKLQRGVNQASENPESPQGQLITKLSNQVLDSALRSYVKRAIDDPQGNEGQTLGDVSQLIFYYSLDTLSQLMPENPNEPAHPTVNALMKRIEDHAAKSTFAAFGKIMNNMKNAGIDVKAGGIDVGGLMGMLGDNGGKGGGIGQIAQLASTLGQLQNLGDQGQLTSPHISRQQGSPTSGWY